MIIKKEQETSQVGGMLGEGVTLEGTLTFNQTFRIDGSFTGKILKSDRLVIGEKGKVTGEIQVNGLVVYGTVEGTLNVKGPVEIHPKGRIRGELHMSAPLLSVMEGGMIEGTVRLDAKSEGVVTQMPSKGTRD